MGRRCKITFYKLENEIIKMYFLENKTLEEITLKLNKDNYYVSIESVRRFIKNIKELLKKNTAPEIFKCNALLEHRYKIESNLLQKLY